MIVILPESGSKNLNKRRIIVDFPQPLGPTKAKLSPVLIVKETPFKIGRESVYPKKTFSNLISYPLERSRSIALGLSSIFDLTLESL